MEIMKFTRVRENAVPPQRGSAGAAGLDLAACIGAPLTIAPGARASVPTGIAIALPGRQSVGLIYARSGLAVRHGLALTNGVGVIDSDYRGEILVSLVNTGGEPYTIQPGERVAQLIVTPVLPVHAVEVEALGGTARGANGFGSTGRTGVTGPEGREGV